VRERAAAEVLRLYLHCPTWRSRIRADLRRLDLEDFALQHHRQLWATIGEIEEDNLGSGRLEQVNRGIDPGQELADLDLPRLLGDRLVLDGDHSILLTRLTPLLQPSDVQRLSLRQPELQLRGATASLERQRTLKRCRHLLDAWSAQRLATLEQCIAQLLEASAPALLAPSVPLASLASPSPAAAPPPSLVSVGSGGPGSLAPGFMPPGSGSLQPVAALLPTPLLDMEERIDQLFASLNTDALRFQEAYYSERRYLGELDQRRCAGFEEILASPAA